MRWLVVVFCLAAAAAIVPPAAAQWGDMQAIAIAGDDRFGWFELHGTGHVPGLQLTSPNGLLTGPDSPAPFLFLLPEPSDPPDPRFPAGGSPTSIAWGNVGVKTHVDGSLLLKGFDAERVLADPAVFDVMFQVASVNALPPEPVPLGLVVPEPAGGALAATAVMTLLWLRRRLARRAG
jgi:hypothetical protein